MSDVRYIIEKHTNHPTHCWRLRDTATDETIGSGLTSFDALALATRLIQEQHA